VKTKFTILFVFVLAAACFLYTPKLNAQSAGAQQPSATAQQGIDQDVKLLREDIRAKKKKLVAANLQLTPDQATKFWPVYDQYTAELVKINDEKYALIKEYANAWGTMTDDQATGLIDRALAVDEKVAQLRTKYVPLFNKVVPGKTTATFFQLDRRIQAMIDLQLGAQLPLVQDQN